MYEHKSLRLEVHPVILLYSSCARTSKSISSCVPFASVVVVAQLATGRIQRLSLGSIGYRWSSFRAIGRCVLIGGLESSNAHESVALITWARQPRKSIERKRRGRFLFRPRFALIRRGRLSKTDTGFWAIINSSIDISLDSVPYL